MKLIGSDILYAEAIRRRAKMPAELAERVDVGLLRRRREIADRHVFDHALAKRARRSHRGPPVVRGVDVTVTSSQTGGFTSAPLLQHRGSRFVQFAHAVSARIGSAFEKSAGCARKARGRVSDTYKQKCAKHVKRFATLRV